jgi:hypothetical protein
MCEKLLSSPHSIFLTMSWGNLFSVILLLGLVGSAYAAGGPVNSFQLYPGWNFISTPLKLQPEYDTPATLFFGVDIAQHSIWSYNAANESWVRVKPSDHLQPLNGIWIYSSTSVQIPLTFSPEQPSIAKNLSPGWNAIGHYGTISRQARDCLSSLGTTWKDLIGFDASSQVYEITIIRGASGTHADTGMLCPTKGYWILMNEGGILASSVSTPTPTPSPTPSPVPSPTTPISTPTPTLSPTPTSTPTPGPTPCSCSGNLYNCGDFAIGEAQACYNHCISQGMGDIHDLDRDHDGIACE